MSGTSMATPHVAGAAALVLSQCPINTASLKSVLLGTVDPVPSLTGLTVTGGRLNVDTAVRNCSSAPPAPPPPPPPSAPAAPTALSASGGVAQVTLAWNPSMNANSYTVKRGTVSGGESTIATLVATTSYSDSSVAAGTTYYYVVTAVGSGGESPSSNEASATPVAPAPVTPPAAPTLAAATGPGAKKISLTWTASAGATSYTVARSQTNGGPYATIASVTGTTYQNTGISGGATYYYIVTAVNEAGASGPSNQASAKAK
jgi:cellulose 1,4-beta-cellobiosidase